MLASLLHLSWLLVTVSSTFLSGNLPDFGPEGPPMLSTQDDFYNERRLAMVRGPEDGNWAPVGRFNSPERLPVGQFNSPQRLPAGQFNSPDMYRNRIVDNDFGPLQGRSQSQGFIHPDGDVFSGRNAEMLDYDPVGDRAVHANANRRGLWSVLTGRSNRPVNLDGISRVSSHYRNEESSNPFSNFFSSIVG